MLIERLELRNFEGYKQAEIDFTKGLNIITGRNSTGKTTILEAILFALYGGGPGLEKKLLVSRLQGSAGLMSVKLTANMQGKRVEIIREGRLVGKEDESKRFRTERLDLMVDGKTVPIHGEEELNKKISELTGMGVKMFTTLIYSRQGELTSILEPKKEDMDLILGISIMKELTEQLDSAKKSLEKYEGRDAKTVLDMYLQQLPKTMSQIDQLAGQVNRLSREVEELEKVVTKAKSKELLELIGNIEKRDSILWKIREKETAIISILAGRGVKSIEELNELTKYVIQKGEELKSELQQLIEEEKGIENIFNDLSSKLNKIEAFLKSQNVSSLRELEQQIASLKNECQQLNGKLREEEGRLIDVENTRNQLNGKYATLTEEVKSHEDLLSKGLANCPTCGQEIDPTVLEQIIEDKKELMGQLAQRLQEVDREYQNRRETVQRLRQSLTERSLRLNQSQKIHDEITTILDGKTIEELEKSKAAAEKDLNGIRETIKEQNEKLAKLLLEKEALEKDKNTVNTMIEERRSLEQELSESYKIIQENLRVLGLPFQPEDADLKAKIAEHLPLSLEELSKKEEELERKKDDLKRLTATLDGLQKEEREMKEKVALLQKRLSKVKICDELLAKIKGGIESQRERRLRRIADEALRIYETLTDQRVYKAFRINRDDYTVEVFPSRLEGYIPAKRTGGGHQTLIALAFRIALLHVLNQRSLLILDEPTYGVDSENLPQLMSYFSEAAKKLGQTILVTHYGLGEEEAANIIKVGIAPDGSSTASKT